MGNDSNRSGRSKFGEKMVGDSSKKEGTWYALLHTIFVIYLEMNLSEKFNWNLRYILIPQ